MGQGDIDISGSAEPENQWRAEEQRSRQRSHRPRRHAMSPRYQRQRRQHQQQPLRQLRGELASQRHGGGHHHLGQMGKNGVAQRLHRRDVVEAEPAFDERQVVQGGVKLRRRIERQPSDGREHARRRRAAEERPAARPRCAKRASRRDGASAEEERHEEPDERRMEQPRKAEEERRVADDGHAEARAQDRALEGRGEAQPRERQPTAQVGGRRDGEERQQRPSQVDDRSHRPPMIRRAFPRRFAHFCAWTLTSFTVNVALSGVTIAAELTCSAATSDSTKGWPDRF